MVDLEPETSPMLRADEDPPQETNPTTGNTRLGYACTCGSLLTAACTFTFIRLAAHTFTLPPSTILFLRGFFLSLLALPYMFIFTDVTVTFCLPRKALALLLVRGILGGIVYLLLINSIALLSAGDSSAFKATYLVFTTAMSAIFLRERLNRTQIIAFVLAVSGALVISQSTGQSPNSQGRGAVYGLSSAALMSGSTTALRGMGKSAHFMWPVISLGIFSAAVGCLAGGLDTLFHLTALQTTGVGVMMVSGVFAFLGQVAFSVALRHCKAGAIAMIESVDVPVTYLFGIIFLDELPTISRLIGAILMVGAAVLVASSERR